MTATDRANLRERVETALGAFLTTRRALLAELDPALEPVAAAIEAFTLGGGKRLRPAFAYWGYRGAGGADRDQVVAAVSALELVQTAALIHDDVMDESATRRGEPSVHRRFTSLHEGQPWVGDPSKFGVAAAILLGDLSLIWSDEMLRWSGLDAAELHRARGVFDLMRTEVICGQYLDLHAQVTADASVHRAGVVARLKSAKYTVERPLLLGAAIADATDELCQAYAQFGLPVGEAFQLRDDILGVFGDPQRTGKPSGDDLREGKRTYLVAAALESTDIATGDRLQQRLGDHELDDDGVAELREIIVASGALDRTEQRITWLTKQAVAALDQVRLPAEAYETLVTLAEAATHRSG